MENITLGTIASSILWLGAFISGCLVLLKYTKSIFKKVITEPITNQMIENKKELDNKISKLQKELNEKINTL